MEGDVSPQAKVRTTSGISFLPVPHEFQGSNSGSQAAAAFTHWAFLPASYAATLKSSLPFESNS